MGYVDGVTCTGSAIQLGGSLMVGAGLGAAIMSRVGGQQGTAMDDEDLMKRCVCVCVFTL